MIKVTVLYPNDNGSKFNFDYYLKKHMPMTIGLLGKALLAVEVERGVSGMTPGSPALYTAICHLYFDSMESFGSAFMPNMGQIQADVPNYTDIEPVIQFSDVLLKK